MEEISSIDAFVEATGNVDVLVVHGTGWSCREGRASVQALGRPGWQCKAGDHSTQPWQSTLVSSRTELR